MDGRFVEWDDRKNRENTAKHGVAFELAELAFHDPHRVIARDLDHSTAAETRFYCFARVGEGVLTVRFTYRQGKIRIFGAGYWRMGRKTYEQQNQVH